MDFELVNSLLNLLGVLAFFSLCFVIPSLCSLFDTLARESKWRTKKIISDLGYIQVKKKFLCFTFNKYVKSEK